jgi:hypothetical protein
MADAGCSAHEIAAWSGHVTLIEVTRYTKKLTGKSSLFRRWRALQTGRSENVECLNSMTPIV